MSETMDLDAPAYVLEGSSSVQAILHPLVLIDVADHIKRFRLQAVPVETMTAVVGLLFGTQEGHIVEIINSCEVVCMRNSSSSDLTVDGEDITKRVSMIQQVLPDYELVGWYAAAQEPSGIELHIHKQMCEHIDNPLMLLFKFNPEDKKTKAELPGLFESISEESGGIHHFVKVPFHMETEDAENTALNHIAKIATSTGDANDNSKKSQVSLQMTQQLNAISMLHSRTKTICEYLTDVNNGKLELNPSIIREISNLCHRLPVLDDSDFHVQSGTDQNDVLLTIMLATLTKGCNKMNKLSTTANGFQSNVNQKQTGQVGWLSTRVVNL
eukprot:CFRG0302T1